MITEHRKRPAIIYSSTESESDVDEPSYDDSSSLSLTVDDTENDDYVNVNSRNKKALCWHCDKSEDSGGGPISWVDCTTCLTPNKSWSHQYCEDVLTMSKAQLKAYRCLCPKCNADYSCDCKYCKEKYKKD